MTKKRYLDTLKLEEVLQKLKEGQYIFVDNEDDHYITMVNNVICERSKDGWKVNKEFFMNGNCYFEEEEPMQEATEEDIHKLCWFWGSNNKNMELGVLESVNCGEDEIEYESSDGFCYHHCRRLSPAEVSEITGYKMEEAE